MHKSYEVSVTHPHTYAQRFQAFMKQVFVTAEQQQQQQRQQHERQ